MNGPETVLADGALADVAPTLLELLGLSQPSEMTGHSLLVSSDAGPSVRDAKA